MMTDPICPGSKRSRGHTQTKNIVIPATITEDAFTAVAEDAATVDIRQASIQEQHRAHVRTCEHEHERVNSRTIYFMDQEEFQLPSDGLGYVIGSLLLSRLGC